MVENLWNKKSLNLGVDMSFKTKKRGKSPFRIHEVSFLVMTFFLLLNLVSPAFGAPTTSLTIQVIENNTTAFERVLDYQWMEQNLPVIGDGTTHYYHQGPVFKGDPWDPNETVNLRDMGAIKGTAVVDICNLAGGLATGDEVMIKASDGYHIQFTPDFLISPPDLAGPLTIAWYNGAESGAGERQGTGYVPEYFTGMRLMICASENPKTGKHVFGNTDMNITLPAKAQYFYSGLYPSTSGLSSKWVDEVRIYRGGYTGDPSAPIKSIPEPTKTPASGLSVFSLLVSGLVGITAFYMSRRV